MNWIDRLERKFGRFAIPNLTAYIVGCYVVGYAVSKMAPQVLSLILLEPSMIIYRLQLWRLFTWIFVPVSGNLISLLIMSLLYYSLGKVLERSWGTFRYNLYIFSGLIFTVLGAFLAYFVMGGGASFVNLNFLFTTNYINLSIFLAFAVSFPEMEVYLYFIIPVKMKWMALIYAAGIGYYFIMGNLPGRISILASILNFLLFYLTTRKGVYRSGRAKREFGKKVKNGVHMRGGRGGFGKGRDGHSASHEGALHRCAVCGRTNLTNPELEFRYCSKCNGNYEYCQDHLFTHEHVK